MHGCAKRHQAGQAVVLVAIAVLVLTAILALVIDGGGIFLDRRQLQTAADAGALAGAELLWSASPPNYTAMHNQALSTIVKNLPGTSASGIMPTNTTGGGSPWTIGQYTVAVLATSYTYQVTLQHLHAVAVAPIHGFQSTMTLQVQATAQNMNLPYAIVLLQDQYVQWSNFNINGSPGSVTFQGPGGTNGSDRGGMFSNESIAAGGGTPSIIFGSNAGDLWAVNESSTDRTALNQPGVVTGSQLNSPPNLPFAASHIDFPNYPEPAPPAVTYNGATAVTGSLTYLCPGQYSNQIIVQNGATAVLLPGVYQVQANGVSVQGTLRTLGAPGFTDSYPIAQCGQNFTSQPADTGVIIEVTPANASGSTTCNKHIFSAAATSTISLTPSTKYYNISLYIETMPNWQTQCSSQPLGTNVVRFSGGACYSIGGAIYGPADNMVLTGSGCGTGVGQIIAWTLTINGNGNVNETYNPSAGPYMKGLIQ
jgi:Flp pilus assembly protein TadG